MNTSHPRRISRKAAEQLLDGAAGLNQGTPAGPERLISVLTAAAAPGRTDELAGERMAVAAFEANHLASLANSSGEQEQMIKSPLAKLLTIKVLAASLVVCAGGGVALAASTGTFSGSGPTTGGPTAGAPLSPSPIDTLSSASASPAASGSASAGAPVMGSPAGGAPAATATASPAASASPSPASIPQTATGLCRALISTVTGGSSQSQSSQEQALASSQVSVALNKSEFASLTSTAQSSAAVPDYCALLLGLPQLPDPSAITQLPVGLLSTLLTQLPTATLAQVLTSLPSSTLSTLLTELPTSTVSQLLTSLPSSTVTQLLNSLPTSAVSQLLTSLPSSVVSGLSGLSGLSSSVSSLLSGL